MKLLPKRPLSHRRLPLYAFGIAFGLALAAPMFVGLAHAFTIDEQSNTNSDGSAKYVDPDARVSRFGSGNDGQTTIRQGNTTLQLGSQPSFDQRFNKQQMFEPNGRPLGDR
jgi:hypothetical protein